MYNAKVKFVQIDAFFVSRDVKMSFNSWANSIHHRFKSGRVAKISVFY